MRLEGLRTPCFLVDEKELKANILDFQDALKNNFDKYIIGYSYKTNSLPYIINKVKELGCYAEVVSDTEYALALEIGYDKKNIIFNGPIKGEEFFKSAVLANIPVK